MSALDVSTILDVLRLIRQHDRADTFRYRVNGQWRNLPAKQICRRIGLLAKAMQSWGVTPGDRVAILSENRPEWAIADFAALLIGAVDVSIYPTLTAEQTAFILGDAGAKIVFVSNEAQYKKVRSVQAQTVVERIVPMDEVAGQLSLTTVCGEAAGDSGIDMDALIAQAKPEQLATIIYTSGTTGTPKGVMLTHGNIASNLCGVTSTFDWSSGEGFISFLPLSHITARHVDYLMMGKGIAISYCSSVDDISRTLMEVRPHNFVSVPRVYEKVRQEAERRAGRGLTKTVFDWAMSVGRRHRDQVLRGEKPSGLMWQMANALVFRKINDSMGGRLDNCISGGAPLNIEVAQWFADAGIRIFEGYGLTETSPVIAINTATHYRLGSVGRPVPNMECRLEADGELLVRGPAVTQGYWKRPQETAEAFKDGWFCTGDIAQIDADGYISITDRKKDLIKTSGGKFIAPQPIENALKSNVLVAHAAVIGDKRRFASVLIAPHFALLEDWARANGVPFASRADLVHQDKVRAMYEGIVSDLNGRLAQFERLKRVLLVPDEFSVATGELTPSLKLKRRVVEKKYSSLIEGVYAGGHS